MYVHLFNFLNTKTKLKIFEIMQLANNITKKHLLLLIKSKMMSIRNAKNVYLNFNIFICFQIIKYFYN